MLLTIFLFLVYYWHFNIFLDNEDLCCKVILEKLFYLWIIFILFYSKETKWGCDANEQLGLGSADAAAREEEQVFGTGEVVQALEVEAKKEIRQIRGRLEM